MKQYDKYKDSGVEWIGEIPTDWSMMRLKGNTYLKGRIGWQNLRTEEFIDKGPYCITGTDFINGKINWSTCYRVSEERYEIDDKIQIQENDLLITKDGTIGKTALISEIPYPFLATLNSGIMVIRPKTKKYHTRFQYWILNSEVFHQFNNHTKSGSTILHLYQNVFERMPFPVPSIEEQTIIANYLDDYTSQIDTLITNKTQQIERLKEIRQIEINRAVTKGLDAEVEMKDSGVEWIGEIPKHWEVRKQKYVTTKIGDGIHATPKYVASSKYFFVNGNNLNSGKIAITPTTKCVSQTEFEAHELDLTDNTLLLSINGTIGNLAFYNREKVVFGKSAAYLSYKEFISREFIFYLLQSKTITTFFENELSGTTIKNLSLGTLRNVHLPMPEKVEQIIIAKYLDRKTKNIDILIKNHESQITQLQEIRKIEIYNAVTGKIKIT